MQAVGRCGKDSEWPMSEKCLLVSRICALFEHFFALRVEKSVPEFVKGLLAPCRPSLQIIE
jgi:hypothetical protein